MEHTINGVNYELVGGFEKNNTSYKILKNPNTGEFFIHCPSNASAQPFVRDIPAETLIRYLMVDLQILFSFHQRVKHQWDNTSALLYG